MMKSIIFIGFLIIPFFCELTRHSDDVLKRERIFIEAHRGVTEGQNNHNTKEAILNAIKNNIEAFETDAWLTSDKKVILLHDEFLVKKYKCTDLAISSVYKYDWSYLEKCKTREGGYKIPLLEDIMNITKGKIFMNLEIKDDNIEIWDKIEELIEKYEYYDQISISSYKHNYYEHVQNYNIKNNRTIVFGFLYANIVNIYKQSNYNYTNHQISMNALLIGKNPKILEAAHKNGMTVAVYFFTEPNNRYYYDLFEIGVDVIITDYPIRVANQLKEYYLDKIHLEGCETIDKNSKNISICTSCQNGYEKVYIKEQDRTLCKLKYEIDPDLYINNGFNVYYEKNLIEIKMLWSPIDNENICYKNNKTIFYFEWLFDLLGYDYYLSNTLVPKLTRYKRRFVLNTQNSYSDSYAKLTESHIKQLDFSNLEIYVEDNLIDKNDILCIDLFDTNYLGIYRVMGLHCYFVYNVEQEYSYQSYQVEFKLFDDNYISFVSYDNKFLEYNDESHGKSSLSYFYHGTDSFCKKMKDPFQERISCINNINDCMYCKNESVCIKCNDGFTLFNGECQPQINYENNLKYFSPDNGTNYYICSERINGCEECSYDDSSFNKFHCSKCSKGLTLNETYECLDDIMNSNLENMEYESDELAGKYINFDILLYLGMLLTLFK